MAVARPMSRQTYLRLRAIETAEEDFAKSLAADMFLQTAGLAREHWDLARGALFDRIVESMLDDGYTPEDLTSNLDGILRGRAASEPTLA